MPFSLSWFVATAIIFVLQWIPYTGIFLMLVAAPVWSVITINAGFTFLAIEALIRPGYRIWLLAPALYFGGYALATTLSHREFEALDNQIKAANATQKLTFDGSRHDLIVKTIERSGSASSLAATLVRHYGVAVAYSEAKYEPLASHVSHRLAVSAVCSEVRKDSEASAAKVSSYGLREGRARISDLCTLQGPEDPARPAWQITVARTKPQTGTWLKATLDEIDVQTPEGHSVRVTSGFAAPLKWWPMPAMGCGLNSARPAWQCSAGFLRESWQGLGGEGAYGQATAPVVAHALGLTKKTLDETRLLALSELPDALKATIARRREVSLTNLDRIIADPSVRLTLHDIRGLRDQPDLWRDRITGMLAALETALDGGGKTRERAGMLQDLLNTLPSDANQAVAERMLAMIATRPALDRDVVRGRTLERLGDLGVKALPVLASRLWTRPNSPSVHALLGLCRIGPAAAHLTETISAPLLSDKDRIRSSTRFAAIVTLLRLGRADLADAVAQAAKRADRLTADVRDLITPASAADACATRSEWSSRLSRQRRAAQPRR